VSFLNDINEVDSLLRELNKIKSKMNMGQFIPAWRDLGRVITMTEKIKEDLLKSQEKSSEKQN
jgi:hypothetical protein